MRLLELKIIRGSRLEPKLCEAPRPPRHCRPLCHLASATLVRGPVAAICHESSAMNPSGIKTFGAMAAQKCQQTLDLMGRGTHPQP